MAARNMQGAALILVHGACHGGWCWEKVMPLLEAAGLRVLAPDLPDWDDSSAIDPIRFWGGTVAGMAEAEAKRGRVLLVGHSRGGVVASAAAEAAPDAIAGLIYVVGSLLPRGQSMTGAWRAFSDEDADWVEPAPDGVTFTIRKDSYHAVFCPDADAATAERALARLRPEPIAAFKTPLRVSDTRFGRVPRAYVGTRDDQIIPPAFQQSMRDALPCDPVLILPGDHMPMLARPAELAEALIRIAGAV